MTDSSHSKSFIRCDGKKHNIPRGLVGFLQSTEAQEGVESVAPGRITFTKKNFLELEINVKYYEERTRTFRVVASLGKCQEPFFVRIKPEYEERVRGYLNSYALKN